MPSALDGGPGGGDGGGAKDRAPIRNSARCLAALLITITLLPGGALAVGPPDPPDLTKGETLGGDRSRQCSGRLLPGGGLPAGRPPGSFGAIARVISAN